MQKVGLFAHQAPKAVESNETGAAFILAQEMHVSTLRT